MRLLILICALVACVLSGAALVVSLTHSGPPGLPGRQGGQGIQGPAGPQGPAGDSGTTPYSNYNSVCNSDFTDPNGVLRLYYFPCTNGVQPVPGT